MTVKAPAILKRSPLRLGFIPLMGAALLFVAAEQRLFQKHGLEVELSPEPSWANIRDKVALGALDGAHMLATMPLAATLGIGDGLLPPTPPDPDSEALMLPIIAELGGEEAVIDRVEWYSGSFAA